MPENNQPVIEYGTSQPDAIWREGMDRLNRGELVEISEATYDYFLNVLPPIDMSSGGHSVRITLIDGTPKTVGFITAEGAETIKAF
jgi:hypothetical protein